MPLKVTDSEQTPIILKALIFTSNTVQFLSKKEATYLCTDIDPKERRNLIRTVSQNMRKNLPVPCIYAATQFLERIESYIRHQGSNRLNETNEKLPKQLKIRTDLDYSLYANSFLVCTTLYEFFSHLSEFEEDEWDIYETFANFLSDLVTYLKFKHFGV